MNKKIQYVCLWSFLVAGNLFAMGMWQMAHFIPPSLPSSTALEIAQMYRDNVTGIRLGMVLAMAGVSGFWLPFIALISAHMRRMEGATPVLTYTQLLSGLVAALVILIPMMLWAVAAFRPERDPELTLLLNDLGWLINTMVFGPYIIQNASIGLAILNDKTSPRILPRWLAFVNFWTGAAFLPAALILFFKTGPFAWNGLFGFWIPVVAFAIWTPTMMYCIYKAIQRQPENT